MRKLAFIILFFVLLSCPAFALTNDVSMEGHLQVTRVDGNVWVTDPVGSGGAPVTIGIASEVGGQLLDYGCNYQQLFDNQTGKINTSIAGGFFRIDLRPAYDNEFFNVKWIPPAGVQANEITLYSVSTRGAMSMIGGVRAATYESFVTLGTPPLTVVSSTTCTNLNADYLDGYHASYFAGRFITHEVLSSGTSYTTPANCAKILVQVVGGGGGGGGVSGVAGANAAAGGGGGAGSYAEKLFYVSASTGYTYGIGGGGAGGANTGGTGTTGGNTTFTVSGVTVTANGGVGGVGMTSAATVTNALGGAGGAVSTGGDMNCTGQPGGYAYRASGTVAMSGAGGPSYFGGGGNSRNTTGANPGGNYGSGGGGAMSTGNNPTIGGAGAGGVIIVWAFSN